MDFGLLAASVLGNVAGGSAANAMMGSSGVNYDALLNQYNSYLTNALNSGLGYSGNYTNQAIGQSSSSLQNALAALNGGQSSAANNLINYNNAGFNIAQSLISPYTQGGYSANKAYMQSLGLDTSGISSAADIKQQQLSQQAGLLKQQLGGNVTNPGAAPVNNIGSLQDYINSQVTRDAINKQRDSSISWVPGGGYQQFIDPSGNTSNNLLLGDYGWGNEGSSAMQAMNNLTTSYLTNQATSQYNKMQSDYQTQLDAYNKQLGNYNQYNDWVTQNGYDPNYVASTANATNNAAGVAGSAGAGNNAGLANFLNSPEYQLLFGSNAANQYTQNGTYDPVTAFQQDPGYQFALNKAMGTMNAQAASKGLLNSTSLQKNLLDYSTGMMNQNYQQYQSNLASTFGNYQNQLAGYTSLGSGLTGANTAASMYGNLGTQLGNLYSGTGQAASQANLGVGSDIASLLANQGSLGASAYLNTGAAQANGLLNIAGMAQQAQSAQAASQANTASSLMANQGYQQAMANAGVGGTGGNAYTGSFGRTGGTF